MSEKVAIEEITYRENLYPRFGYDEETVNQYRLNIDDLPPIIISENNVLIDGYHRLIAHRIEQRTEIEAERLPIITDKEIDKEGAERNSKSGKQLTIDEKKAWVRERFGIYTIAEFAKILSVSTGKVSEWTQDLRQAQNEEENAKIIDLWLACKTQKEISDILDVSQPKVSKIITSLADEDNNKIAPNPPDSLKVFNLWNFGKSNDALQYPGQIPSQIIENLLWYYTKPFDVVYDPMAGGGTSLRVCKSMYRRWQASDIAPVIDEIKSHDITQGFPDWLTKPNFIFLDPPYWDMKKGEYSASETNLANMSLADYYNAIDCIAKGAKKVLRDSGHIAWIVSATQKDGNYYDHADEFMQIFKKYFTLVMRCDVPYTTQIVNGATIESAKKAKLILKQTRDLGVFKK